MSSKPILGFIGVGVMGMGMCRNLAQKSGCTVLAADLNADNVRALADDGVIASSVQQIAETARIVFLSLPAIQHVEAVWRKESGPPSPQLRTSLRMSSLHSEADPSSIRARQSESSCVTTATSWTTWR